mmetsp:Transcript_3498/g.7265  ORF Transcript_3498/g.7265 Transcript_3498/m.7265 type:complete len:383 (-) Transcript_3498:593-1741(-)
MWAACLCVVTFHEDYGHMVEVCYPPVLSENAQRNVAALSLPDSNAFNFLSEVSYVFRLKEEADFLYGFVYFKQSRDQSQERGFTQKSLVLLSTLPCFDLFKGFIAKSGPLFFAHGPSFIEVLWATIRAWPNPMPNTAQILPYLGIVRKWNCPLTEELTEVNYYQSLGFEAFEHLWLVWESMLMGDPILILADDAMLCSDAVLQLLDLIHPLKYQGDYRPFFSLLDADFKQFLHEHDTKEFKPVLVGMTNPIAIKTFSDWPLILQLKRHARSIKVEALKTKRTSYLGPIRHVLNSFVDGEDEASEIINSSKLRNHFYELTLHLLKPLRPSRESYASFDPQEFLKYLMKPEVTFPLLRFTSRPKAIQLYARFIQSETFEAWLRS